MDNIKDYILKFLRLESVVEHLSGYVESKVALVKMEIREEVAHVIAKGIIAMVLLLFGFMFLLFLSIGVAHYVNIYFEGAYAGFLLVGGFYGLVFLMLVIFRKSFLHSFEKKIIESIRKKER